ncbi:MAG: hypothetical protein H6735_00050 [Alphaproteobacteria bacterium]|nr:hypothetical protein [Alphaproteobacteria bacterium]
MRRFIGASLFAAAGLSACANPSDEPYGPGAETYSPYETSEVRSLTVGGDTITYAVVNGEVVRGGDMLYGPVDEFEARLAGADGYSVFKDGGRWNMPIRYTFDNDTPNDVKTAVREAMSKLVSESGAQISFQQCTGLCLAPRIKFDYDGQGCASPVGKQLLGNKIHLDTWCDGINSNSTARAREIGSIAHEIMHSLGVEHEQTRCDRNSHVTINAGNIDSCAAHNITDIHCSNHDDFGSYDFASIMHYSSTACSSTGQITIDSGSSTNNALMGSRLALSTTDRAALRAMYGSASSGGGGGGGGGCTEPLSVGTNIIAPTPCGGALSQ